MWKEVRYCPASVFNGSPVLLGFFNYRRPGTAQLLIVDRSPVLAGFWPGTALFLIGNGGPLLPGFILLKETRYCPASAFNGRPVLPGFFNYRRPGTAQLLIVDRSPVLAGFLSLRAARYRPVFSFVGSLVPPGFLILMKARFSQVCYY